jgi:hypothetical protein
MNGSEPIGPVRPLRLLLYRRDPEVGQFDRPDAATMTLRG